MTMIYLVRHGEVHNPDSIIYGRLPGFGLSDRGRDQIRDAAAVLASRGPFVRLETSPLQRARESAAILGEHLGVDPVVDERLVETQIDDYQGKPFASLPRPYITENPVHAGIESACSMRQRLFAWTNDCRRRFPNGRIVAVCHRDPIGVALLHWLELTLDELPGMRLEPGGVHEIALGESGRKTTVRRLSRSGADPVTRPT